ncbi:MAG: competence/damage-inducible protein A [Pseudomonadota bacterium]
MNTNPCFGIIIIGDEVLSGRRQDKHIPAVIERLNARGLRLAWVRMVGDDMDMIVRHLRQAHDEADAVFCFGGIGATPDDLTRAAAAQAFDLPLTRHAEAEARIIAQFGEDAFPYRVLMADLPAGCSLIPNPMNNVPGFSLHDCHFMPGFPQMAHPMLDWVLNQHYAHAGDPDYAEASLWVWDASENQLLELMRAFEQAYPALRLFSLPILPSTQQPRRRIELGLKGARRDLEPAMSELSAQLARLGFPTTTTRELAPEGSSPSFTIHGAVD